MELDQQRFSSEYLLESAHKTLHAGTIAAWLSLPVITGFTLQDIYVLGLHNMWIWRLVGIIPFLGFLVYRYGWSRRFPLLAIRLNVLNIIGILTMMTGIVVNVLSSPASSLLNQYGVSIGLITALFTCLIMAAGARNALAFVIPAILLLATLAMLIVSPVFDIERFGFLSNSYFVGLLVIIFARIQERQQLKAFTLRKKVQVRESQLAEKTTALEVANQDLESFSYSVSHDLRGPLRNMMGLSTIIHRQMRNRQDEEISELAEAILINARKMNQLVNDILAFSRAGQTPVKHETLNMTQLFQEVYEELRPAENGRNIDFALHPLENASGDPGLIRQVVVNLIDNALKYTRKCQQTEIRVEGREGDGQYTYIIADNGAGFDDKQQDKLFTAFQRLHDEHDFEGNGVGLAFAQKVVQRHQGKIWAEGTPGKGATFYFTLPMQTSN